MLVLETPRLRLRYMEERDCEVVAHFLNDPAVALPLITPPHPFALGDAQDFFEKMRKTYATACPEFFVIADKGSDTLIGGIGIHPEHTLRTRENVGEVGYWLGLLHWGHGYMLEALPALLQHALKAMSYRLFVATTNTDNEPSQRVLRAAGFRYLGIEAPIEAPKRGTPTVTSWEYPAAQGTAT